MARWSFRFLVLVSLLLCVGSVVLFVRSFWVQDIIQWQTDNWDDRLKATTDGREQYIPRETGFSSSRGGLSFGTASAPKTLPIDPQQLRWHIWWFRHRAQQYPTHYYPDGMGIKYYRFPGFQLSVPKFHPDLPDYRPFGIAFPIPILTLLTAILPAIALRRYLRHRPHRLPGHCRTCGYDLTGNASGICPECGTAISSGCRSQSV